MSGDPTIAQLECDPDMTVQDLVAHLGRYGIAIVRRHVGISTIGRLREEFGDGFETSIPGVKSIHPHPNNPDGRVSRIDPNAVDREQFCATRELFLAPRLRELCTAYFAPHPCTVSEEVFFTHERPAAGDILPWHFDRKPALKYWVYLTDCDERSGAFSYCPGSHREGRLRANNHLLRGGSIRSIPNDIPAGEVRQATRIAGAAGDLVIFDADGFHKGGTVQPGHERRVMRSHCRPVRDLERRLGVGRLASALLRVTAPLATLVDRQIGAAVSSQARRTRD